MKKAVEKSFIMISALFVVTTMMLCLVRANVYADTYNTDIDEGVSTAVNWGETYDSDAVTYVKIKPSKKGIITFTTDFSCYVSLCNSSKKVISKGSGTYGESIYPESSYAWSRKLYFGVKRGVTYYLKIKNMPYTRDELNRYVGVMKYTNTKVSPSKYGTTKARSKAIRKRKTIKGLFVAGNRKAQWFKITNKQKTTKITFSSSKNCDSLKVTVYYKSYGKWYNSTYHAYRTNGKNVLTGTISKKIKHTYYLKVQPEGKTSGSYTLRWV